MDTPYGFYLRPPHAPTPAQSAIHDLLDRQYGLKVAGKFMPHATVKGFFQSQASVDEMVRRLEEALAGSEPFEVFNGGAIAYGRSAIVLDVSRAPGHERNPQFQALHEVALEALMPLVTPGCAFTAGEWKGPLFHAHLTLAMADVPEAFFDEILAFVREAEPIGPPTFTAEVVQLF